VWKVRSVSVSGLLVVVWVLKYVIQMNMEYDAGCRGSGAGQQGVRPGRGMLHEWPCQVVLGGGGC
jgi:hypothetical protein